MNKVARTPYITVILAAVITLAMPLVTVGSQETYVPPTIPVGCPAGGEELPLAAYFPDLSNGFVVSEERRNAEQLAATFPDSADALSRLNAWCWLYQIERTYTRSGLTIDISFHDFSESAGADLAMRWFSQQRASDLGLEQDGSRSLLQSPETHPGQIISQG
jgi:hypothetical protein